MMQEAVMMETEGEKLWDIDKVDIDKTLPIKDRAESFSKCIKEESLTHLNEGYVVKVHFSNENYSATDAVKHYLQQITQLKY